MSLEQPEVPEVYGIPTPARLIEMSPMLNHFPARFPFTQGDSPSRRDMASSQASSTVTIRKQTIPRIVSGQERENAIYVHRVASPFNGVVRRIIQKHPSDPKTNFQSDVTLIIESLDEPGTFDAIQMPTVFSMDPQFGFHLNPTKVIKEGTLIDKGEVLSQPKSVDVATGIYKNGIGLNVAFMTHFGGIEDGNLIADDLVNDLAVPCIKTVTIPLGARDVPINMFGTSSDFRPFKAVGEYLDEMGILMATRRVDVTLDGSSDKKAARVDGMFGMCMMDYTSIRDLDPHDTLWKGEPNARIINIEVLKVRSKNSSMLGGTESLLEHYRERTLQYYKAILREYEMIRKELPPNSVRIRPEFSRLVIEAMMIMESTSPRTKVTLVRQKAPLDEWEIRFTYEYYLAASNGTKMTDPHGGKVVSVTVVPRSHMPVDEYGTSADLVMLEQATSNRMNTGREVYMACTAAGHRLKLELIDSAEEGGKTEAFYEHAYRRITLLYSCIDPIFADQAIRLHRTFNHRKVHVEKYLKHGMYVGRNYDTNVTNLQILQRLNEHFDIKGTRVRYVDPKGDRVKTEKDVLIAELNMHVLEKVADTSAAVSSARMQHFNIPANATKQDKATRVSKDVATRAFGETETRIVTTHTPENTLAEIFDQSANVVTHMNTALSIVSAENPMDIEQVADRTEKPPIGGRISATVQHMIEVSGKKLVYIKPAKRMTTDLE